MGKPNKQVNSDQLAEAIKEAILEKKGEKIVLLDLKNLPGAVCDYFVICHGNSDTHVSSIAEEIEVQLKQKHGEFVYHKEGHQNAQWILLDYANVVAHIFQKETRAYYGLEELWADATIHVVEMEY